LTICSRPTLVKLTAWKRMPKRTTGPSARVPRNVGTTKPMPLRREMAMLLVSGRTIAPVARAHTPKPATTPAIAHA
jgi:hypothetical protein